MSIIQSILFLCPVIFLASFVDAISGGGGLLSLPAFLFTGMPVHNAYGCNKFSCNISTWMSTYRYYKSGNMDRRVAFTAGVAVFLSSICASRIVLSLPDQFLRVMILVSMPFVAALILISRKYPQENQSHTISGKKRYGFCVLIGIIVGFYDGLLGPGSGTLAILLYTKLFKYDLKTASGNAKVAVLASTLAATLSYILAGKVIWVVTIPVTICGVLGSYLGSGMAIRKGARFIRPMMLLIAFLLILKMVLDLTGIL